MSAEMALLVRHNFLLAFSTRKIEELLLINDEEDLSLDVVGLVFFLLLLDLLDCGELKTDLGFSELWRVVLPLSFSFLLSRWLLGFGEVLVESTSPAKSRIHKNFAVLARTRQALLSKLTHTCSLQNN